jgi:hypothetical protein
MKTIHSQIVLDAGRAPGKDTRASLRTLAHTWDRVVRNELQQMAKILWPDKPWMGFMPVNTYRLRKQITGKGAMWWIERDISPFDRFQCAAYRVELTLAGTDQPRWIVRSGIAAYPLPAMSAGDLKSALQQASGDVPMIIRRKFGPALDP